MFRWTPTDSSQLALVLNFSSLHFGLTRTPPWTSPPVTSPQSKTGLLHQHSLTSSVKCILMASICQTSQMVLTIQWSHNPNGGTLNQAHLLILTCLHKVLTIFGTTPMMRTSIISGNKVLTKLLSMSPIALSMVLVAWVVESSTILIMHLFQSTTPLANSPSELVSRFSTLHLHRNSQSCNQHNRQLLSTLPYWTLVSSLPTGLPTLVFQHSNSQTFPSLLLLTLSQPSDGSTK